MMNRKSLLLTLLMALFAPWAMYGQGTTSMTVYDGIHSNNHIPAYIYYFDEFTRSQFVIPADDLETLGDGAVISAVTFYADQAYPASGKVQAPVDVYLKEVSYTSISAFEATSSATTVYSGVLATGDGNVMTITFTTPYTYHNGNLLIGIENTEEKNWQDVYFYGQTATGASVSGSGSSLSGVSANQQNFIPKTTLTYVPGVVSGCIRPTLGAAEYIWQEGASFQWTENGSATQWQLQYSTSADFANPTTIDRSGIPAYAITGLSSGTTYYVHVRSYCSDGEWSNWSKTVSFRTACEVQSLPYFCGFEDGDEWECWKLDHCAESTGVINNSIAHLGNAAFRFVYNTTPPQYLISPEFEGTSMLFMSFYYKNASDTYPETFQVGYSTTTDATDAFTWEPEITANDQNTWNFYQNTFPRGTKFVAIKLNSYDQYFLYLDDFYFEAPITCFAPADFAVADINSTTATLSWNDNEAQGYEMEYLICPAYNFDDGTLQGWTNIIVNADGGQWLHSDDNPGGYMNPSSYPYYPNLAHSGNGFAMCYSKSNDSTSYHTDAYLVSPSNYQISNGASINFWYDMAKDVFPEYFEVCVATVAHPTTDDFTPIWSLPANNDKGQKGDARICNSTRVYHWRNVAIDLSAYAGQTIWIAFHDVNEDMYEVWIDDVVINNCPFPRTPAPAPIVSPYTLRGLDPETSYMVRLRSICDYYNESDWTSITFNTPPFSCEAPSELEVSTLMPTSATFDWTGSQGNYEIRYRTAAKVGFLEDCESNSLETNGWTVLREGEGIPATDWHIVYYEDFGNRVPAHSGDYYIVGRSWSARPYSVDNWLISPQVTLDGELSFWAMDGGDYHEHYDVYVSTTTAETSAFTLLYEPGDASTEWTQHTIDLSSYAGHLGYIAFRLVDRDKDYLFIDDITIGSFDETPAGPWITVNSNTTTVDIAGLDPETKYEWQVRGINSDCDGGMTDWSDLATFITLNACSDITSIRLDDLTATTMTLNWTGVQESYQVQYRTAEVNEVYFYDWFEDGLANWTEVNTSAYNDTIVVTSSGAIGYVFFTDDAVSGAQTLISTEMEPTTSGTTLDFYNASRGNSIYKVGFSSTDNALASFTWTEELTCEGDGYFHECQMEVPEGTKYFAIQFVSIDSGGIGYFIIAGFDVSNYIAAPGEWNYITVNEPNVTITGLTPATKYNVYVIGICGEDEYTMAIGGSVITLEQTTVTQTIALASGINWVSFYVDINLDALKAALVAAMPVNGVAIAAQNDGRTTYNGGRWRGALSALDLSQMYKITVPEACEITVEGMPIDPAAHPVTIRGGLNWIAFPFMENMTIANAFAGFATNGDQVKSMNDGQTAYNGTRWRGALNTLAPGKGYIYNSAVNGNRTFVFPSSAKAIKPAVIPMGKWHFGE